MDHQPRQFSVLQRADYDRLGHRNGRGELRTPRPAPEQIRGLTSGTTTRQRRLSSRESWSWGDVAASAFVLAAIAAAYLYFTG